MITALQRAVAVFEQPPPHVLVVGTPWGEVELTPAQWSAACAVIDRGSGHNEARAQLHEALIEQLLPQLARLGVQVPAARRHLARNPQLAAQLDEHWPLLDPARLLRALYTIPALLRHSARELEPEQVELLLSATSPQSWTREDLPLLDATLALVGDPRAEVRRQAQDARRESERRLVLRVIDDLISAADDKEDLASQLVNEDLQEQLVGQHTEQPDAGNPTAGPFSHVVIDEAQDLTDAQWAMILRRCPSGSLTIVGDRAQAIGGFPESWQQRLGRVGIDRVRISPLRVNYRSTAQIMEASSAVLRDHLPTANIPRSVRTDGAAVRYGTPGQLSSILDDWLAANPEGTAAVIGSVQVPGRSRVSVMDPAGAKGLEFDLVVVYRPEAFGRGLAGAVRRYVAMTRATAQLVVLCNESENPDMT